MSRTIATRRWVSSAAALSMILAMASAPARAQDLKLPKADVDYDHDADFATFHTFQWKPGQEPLSKPARNMSLVTAIERELEKKGLKKITEGTPDVRVRFYASLEKHIRGTARQSETPYTTGDLRTSVDFEKMTEGMLIVELYQGDTEKRLWRGSTTIRTGKMDEEVMRSAVSLILRSYPPRLRPGSPTP